nr:MAG TPA: hypothetical protein [Caudoviricetes sp.]
MIGSAMKLVVIIQFIRLIDHKISIDRYNLSYEGFLHFFRLNLLKKIIFICFLVFCLE